MEVIAPVDLVGYSDRVPDRSEWGPIAAQKCQPIADAYLGVPVDPRGRFDVYVIHPLAEGWAQGDGTCLIATPDGNEIVVDCGAPHDVEVTGSVDLSQRIDHAPTNDELSRLTATECNRLAGVYLGHALGQDLTTGSRGFDPRSWAAGRRAVECLVGHHQARSWVPVSGAIRTGA